MQYMSFFQLRVHTDSIHCVAVGPAYLLQHDSGSGAAELMTLHSIGKADQGSVHVHIGTVQLHS